MADILQWVPFILIGSDGFSGFVLTLAVSFGALGLAIVLGMLGATAKLAKSRTSRGTAGAYTTLIRGVPDLVLMMLIFYGVQIGVNQITDALEWGYIDINPYVSGVLALGFIFGAYMTESFRGGILAVPKGEIEAGLAYGMTGRQVFFRITLPQMIRHALPSFGNNWLVLTKATALVSIIGLHDVVFNARQVGGTTRQPFTYLLIVAFLYLLLTAVSKAGLARLYRRYSVGVRRA